MGDKIMSSLELNLQEIKVCNPHKSRQNKYLIESNQWKDGIFAWDLWMQLKPVMQLHGKLKN